MLRGSPNGVKVDLELPGRVACCPKDRGSWARQAPRSLCFSPTYGALYLFTSAIKRIFALQWVLPVQMAAHNFAQSPAASLEARTGPIADRRARRRNRRRGRAPSRRADESCPLSAHQSRKLERKPCGVISLRSRRRSSFTSPCSRAAVRDVQPGNTCSPVRGSSRSRRSAGSDSGTRCSRPVLVRAPGISHSAASRSISSHRAPSTSPVLVAVKITSSSARAARPSCQRRRVMNRPTSGRARQGDGRPLPSC